MCWWQAVLREPIVHFLCAGAVLFLIFQIRSPSENSDDQTEIIVNRDSILNFMQYRARAFRGDLFVDQWNAMTVDQQQSLIEDYVHEEALFREAQSMGLREGDYVIRRRMIQRLNFVIDDALAEIPQPAEAELERYFTEHKEDYREPAVYTFTHVFFDSAHHGEDVARSLAEQTLRELNKQQVPYNRATEFGDRFPFFQNYVERRSDFVQSHFGPGMTAALDNITPEVPLWSGPYQSSYGWHLVLLVHRTPTHIPAVADLRPRIMEDFQRDKRDSLRREVTEQIISRYVVRLSDDLPVLQGI